MKLNAEKLKQVAGFSKQRWQSVLCTALLVGVGIAGSQRCGADDFFGSSALYKKLSKPVAMALDGKPFRDAVVQVADQVDLNICFDRQTDPSVTIKAGPLGPTAYAALKKICDQQKCVMFPVANVVLIGRADWVDPTAASLMSITQQSRTTIRWPAYATPDDALAAAVGNGEAKRPSLPHDLWPETNWRGVTRKTAVNLVFSQFGRSLKPNASIESLASQPLRNVAAERRYTASEELAKQIRESDSAAKIVAKAGKLVVTAKATTHRKAADVLLQALRGGVALNDDRRFTLTLINKKAGEVLDQFAKTAGLTCTIDPSATAVCENLVSLEATDKTLAELIQIVAQKVGATVAPVQGGMRVFVGPN